MDSRGSSTVVGVILLVAVAVVAGAAVAGYAFQFSSPIGSTAVGTFSITQTGAATSIESSATVRIRYEAGNLRHADGDHRILVDGVPVTDAAGVTFEDGGFAAFRRGNTVTLVQTDRQGLEGGDLIEVVTETTDATKTHARTRLSGSTTDLGTFSFSYSDCYNCASEGGTVHATYGGGDPLKSTEISVYFDGSKLSTGSDPELRSFDATFADGDSFAVMDRNGEVHGTVKIYFTGGTGSRILLGNYTTP